MPPKDSQSQPAALRADVHDSSRHPATRAPRRATSGQHLAGFAALCFQVCFHNVTQPVGTCSKCKQLYIFWVACEAYGRSFSCKAWVFRAIRSSRAALVVRCSPRVLHGICPAAYTSYLHKVPFRNDSAPGDVVHSLHSSRASVGSIANSFLECGAFNTAISFNI